LGDLPLLAKEKHIVQRQSLYKGVAVQIRELNVALWRWVINFTLLRPLYSLYPQALKLTL